MPVQSAGLLLYRLTPGGPEVFLVHPGGPFWAKKDAGAWSIPKGVCGPGEDPLAAARREFREETGVAPPEGPFLPLGSFRQPGGKVVTAFAAQGDLDPTKLTSNMFDLEWPPKSGRIARFPEVDRGAWFGLKEAEIRLLKGQTPILAALRSAAFSRIG
ncbi:MAG TPA: NUDIX domain-containing protein [Bauldia sp.]|nr:NUDIX domain-containing protein [Bauldia sp.]